MYSILNHNKVSKKSNFMNFILSIYDHNNNHMVMHIKFCQDILGNRGVVIIWFSKCHRIFCPQP